MSDRVGKSVAVELTGGLANQLFQWAAGYQLATANSAALLLDSSIVERPRERGIQISELCPYDGMLGPSKLTRFLWRLGFRYLPHLAVAVIKRLAAHRPRRRKVVTSLSQAESVLVRGRAVMLRGYFQDSDRLYASRAAIRSEVLKNLDRKVSKRTASPYAAIHVRRGDYVSNLKYREAFGVCSEGYYRKAIDLLDPALPLVFVSDDPEWCKAFAGRLDLPGAREIDISSGSHFQDLQILAGASALVLANSTFSWWGAFLGAANTVICPEPWFTDEAHEQGIARAEWRRVARD